MNMLDFNCMRDKCLVRCPQWTFNYLLFEFYWQTICNIWISFISFDILRNRYVFFMVSIIYCFFLFYFVRKNKNKSRFYFQIIFSVWKLDVSFIWITIHFSHFSIIESKHCFFSFRILIKITILWTTISNSSQLMLIRMNQQIFSYLSHRYLTRLSMTII